MTIPYALFTIQLSIGINPSLLSKKERRMSKRLEEEQHQGCKIESDLVPAARKIDKDTFKSGNGNVLLMDDEEVIRESLGELLKIKGYQVECAKDGSEAVDIYRRAMEISSPFDVVILDLTIHGGIGGKEAIKRLLEIDPDVKAIVSSGCSDDPVMEDCSAYGFCGVYAKNDKPEELGRTLYEVING